MRWHTKITPPDRNVYLNRCRALGRCLKSAEIMPPFLVAANCFFTLRALMGGEWGVLRWLILNMAYDRYQRWKETAWWTWQMYVMTRSRDEIIELIDQELEEMTGEDHREWPTVITDEESAEV